MHVDNLAVKIHSIFGMEFQKKELWTEDKVNAQRQSQRACVHKMWANEETKMQ